MTNAALEKLYVAIDASRGFPALERTAISVMNALSGVKTESQEVVSHIMEDFALTQKVLKLANSGMYAPFSTGSSTITSALEVMGSDALLYLVLGASQVNDLELETDASLSRTLLAGEIAMNAHVDRKEDISIVTFMYRFGSLLVDRFLPMEMRAIQRKMDGGAAESLAEVEVLGMTLQQIGVEVAKRWNLPSAIIASMDGTGDPDLIRVAKFSNDAAVLLQAGKHEELQRLVAGLEAPGIDKSKLQRLISQKVLAAAPVNAEGVAVSTLSPLDELFAGLSRQPLSSVDDLAKTAFPAFGRLLNALHCVLFMLTRSGDFAVRSGYGSGFDTIKNKLRISAEFQPTAFHAAIRKNIDVSIDDVSKLKPASLPDGYAELFPDTRKFIILPISPSRVTGLLYFDWDAGATLGPAEMDAVKRLRDLFLPLLPR